MGNLGGISLVKRQGRETTREIKTPRQSRLIRNHVDDILSSMRMVLKVPERINIIRLILTQDGRQKEDRV